MNTVNIAELKSRLSEHLRQVRRGHTLTILDRKTPIARVIPYDEKTERGLLQIREPFPGSPKLHQIPLPPLSGYEETLCSGCWMSVRVSGESLY